jgi:MYXO-CTERM domain-containing protein
MVCNSYESGYCNGTSAGMAPACEPGKECPEPAPVDPTTMCETTVESYCTYKYQLPCMEAADCGAGFECVPYDIVSCGGSAGMETPPSSGTGGASSGGGSDPGAAAASGDIAPMEPAPAEPPADCTTTPSEEKYCKVIDVTCTADSDCEAGWTCEDMAVAMGGCATTDPATRPAGDPAPAMDVDGGAAPAEGEALIAPCDPVPEMATEKKCAPPGYSYGYAYAAADGTVTTSAESGGSTAGGEPPVAMDPGAAPVPGAPGSNMGSTTGGSTTSTGTNANGVSQGNDSGAGCSVSSSPAGGNIGFAGLLFGLAAFAARRKR